MRRSRGCRAMCWPWSVPRARSSRRPKSSWRAGGHHRARAGTPCPMRWHVSTGPWWRRSRPTRPEGSGGPRNWSHSGDRWGSASLRAMGLVSIGRVLSAEDPERARSALIEAVTLAEASHSGLLARPGETGPERDPRGAGVVTGRVWPRWGNCSQGFGRSGDLSQQLQTVVSTLDPLMAVGAFDVATLLCGALGQTALGSVAQCERVSATRHGPGCRTTPTAPHSGEVQSSRRPN